MVDSKGKYIGTPTVTVHFLPATPELVARTRANLTAVLERIATRRNGYPTEVTIDWGEKPKGYGQTRTYRDDTGAPES